MRLIVFSVLIVQFAIPSDVATAQVFVAPHQSTYSQFIPANAKVPGQQPPFQYTNDWENKPILDSISVVPDSVVLDDVDTIASTSRSLKPKLTSVFTAPCHFAYTRFNGYDIAPIDSLVIYEGMKVIVADDGQYEVTFNCEATRIPVVVMLQLSVHEVLEEKETFRHGTITLPPFTIDPDRNLHRHRYSQTYHIRRAGYSHLLRSLFQTQTTDSQLARLSLQRHGTARFGSVPEKADYSSAVSADE